MRRIKLSPRGEINVLIAISALKRIMNVFLGPFLTAYFIKTSAESLADLSVYHMVSYFLFLVGALAVGRIIKRRFQVGMFRIGVITSFIYILSIIYFREKLTDHLFLVSVLSGISIATYWEAFNMFSLEKVKNAERTDYTVRSSNIGSIIGILCPILLGSFITVTDFETTAVIMLFFSFLQVLCSFLLSPEDVSDLPPFSLKRAMKEICGNREAFDTVMSEIFTGFSYGGALDTLTTVLVYNAFKTDLKLGFVNSATTVLAMIAVRLYGRFFRGKSDKKLLLICGAVPTLSVLAVIFMKCGATVIINQFCFSIFSGIVNVGREIRLFNVANSGVIDVRDRCEFFALREVTLSLGRILSFGLMLAAALSGSALLLNGLLILMALAVSGLAVILARVNKYE